MNRCAVLRESVHANGVPISLLNLNARAFGRLILILVDSRDEMHRRRIQGTHAVGIHAFDSLQVWQFESFLLSECLESLSRWYVLRQEVRKCRLHFGIFCTKDNFDVLEVAESSCDWFD